MTKTVNRYVPRKVVSLIKKSTFKNKEHLYIICDMIYRISVYHKKETNYNNQYTDIPMNYFRDIITNGTNFEKAKNYLKDNGIIECDELYSVNRGKAKGYKFNDNLISKLVVVPISQKALTQNIINNRNERNNYVNDTLKPAKDYFVDTFSIDYNAAVQYINQQYTKEIRNTGSLKTTDIIKALNRWNSYYMSISAIKDGDLYFKKNKTNGRVDTNLTNLKKELKQFIANKSLYQIDIVNSQPYLLSILLNNEYNFKLDIEEVKRYAHLTSKGRFYEYMQQVFKVELGLVMSRKDIKVNMFCILYSKNNTYQKEKEIFRLKFPTIMKWIENEKKHTHNELAIKMQNLESHICIDIITAELDKQAIKYYTIHDAWLVNKKDLLLAQEIVNKCFISEYNEFPTFDTEAIN